MSKMAAQNRWQFVRNVKADDANPTNVEASHLPSPRAEQSIAIECKHSKEVEIVLWCIGTSNNTFALYIKGWMEDGAGQIIYQATSASLSSNRVITLESPLTPAIISGNYNMVDTMGGATDFVGSSFSSVTDFSSTFFLPTKGYKYLTIELANVGGALEPSSVDIVWRTSERFGD